MLILTIRTDKPEAEIGIYENTTKLSYITWEANRELSATIHLKLKELLDTKSYSLKDLDAIIAFKGPGSFTGLRIGLSVANAFSYALNIPIVSEESDDWINGGITRLMKAENEKIALPHYGAEPHITQQKK